MNKKIITVANSKGGAGKTTIATNLAVEFAHDDCRVLLVDSDVQQSSVAFRKLRKTPDIKAMVYFENSIDTDLQALDYDRIIIDVGGSDSELFRAAIQAADLVLIPTKPSHYDVWEAKKTIETLERCRMKKDISGLLVLNQVIQNANLGLQVAEVLEHFNKTVPVAKSRLHNRVAFEESVGFGEGVSEYEPGGKAAYEIQGLYSEVLDILEGEK